MKLRNLLRSLSGRSRTAKARSTPLAVESLETRDVMAADDVFAAADVGTAQVALTMNWTSREAGYNNEVGFFAVDDPAGAVDGLLPEDAGYIAAALDRATVAFASGAGAGATFSQQMSAGSLVAFYVVQNATTNAARGGGANVWFTFLEANSDGVEHFQRVDLGSGGAEFRVEDLTGGGDLDFNDVVFTVAAAPVNTAPTAVDDKAATKFATPVVVDVLANDSDPDSGDKLTIKEVEAPSDGTVIVNAERTKVTYTPKLGFAGDDSFRYTIADGAGGEATAYVAVNVDGAGKPVVSIEATDDYAVENPRDTGRYLVRVEGKFDAPLIIHLTLEGTASYKAKPADSDYKLSEGNYDEANQTGTLTINPPSDRRAATTTITLTATKDGRAEPTETATLKLAGTTDYVIKQGYESATVSIRDAKPAVTLDAARVVDQQSSAVFNAVDGADRWLADRKTAYLPVNNDDDDNDGTIDKAQATINLVDNDLLPIAIRKPAGAAAPDGYFTLDFNGKDYRVWRRGEQGFTAVSNTTRLTFEDGDQTDLFVEGLKSGRSAIQLVHHSQAGDKGGPIDTLTIERFTVTGPRNVPGRAIYSYADDLRAGSFVASGGGTNQGGGAANGKNVEILWDEGPVFGKVRYRASDDYTWAFDVAVVQVEVDLRARTDKQGSGLQFADATQNGVTQDPIRQAQRELYIRSTRGRLDFPDRPANQALPAGQEFLDEGAMNGVVRVSRIEGPTRQVDGNDRMFGVSHIEIGIIQELKFTKYNAMTVSRDQNGREIRERVAYISRDDDEALQGREFLDMINKVSAPGGTYRNPSFIDITGDAARFERPWYFAGAINGAVGSFEPDADRAYDDVVLGIRDTPAPAFLAWSRNGGNTLVVDVELVWDFDVSLGVRTKDTDNDADRVFTTRAFAEWQFNASGTVAQNGTWTPGPDVGVRSANPNFQEVTDGTRAIDAAKDYRTLPIVNDQLP